MNCEYCANVALTPSRVAACGFTGASFAGSGGDAVDLPTLDELLAPVWLPLLPLVSFS